MTPNLFSRCLLLGIVGLLVLSGACASDSKGVDAARPDGGAGEHTDSGLHCSGPNGHSYAIGELYLDSCGKPCTCQLVHGKPGIVCRLTLCVDGGPSYDGAVDI